MGAASPARKWVQMQSLRSRAPPVIPRMRIFGENSHGDPHLLIFNASQAEAFAGKRRMRSTDRF